MFIISKTVKGKEFVYSKKYTILCKSADQAKQLAKYLNEHNDSTIGDFKLKENEIWYVYKIDKYDTDPRYKLKIVKGRIAIVDYI